MNGGRKVQRWAASVAAVEKCSTSDLALTAVALCQRRDELTLKRLMSTFRVVVRHVLRDGSTQMSLPKDHPPIERFSANASDEPLRMCTQIRRSRWQSDCLHAALPEQAPEVFGVEGIPIHDEVALPDQEPDPAIEELPADLLHPCTAGLAGDACDLDLAGLELHDEAPASLCSTGRSLRSLTARKRAPFQERTSPWTVTTSTVNESVAASTSQCAARSVFHAVFLHRSGTGVKPCSRRVDGSHEACDVGGQCVEGPPPTSMLTHPPKARRRNWSGKSGAVRGTGSERTDRASRGGWAGAGRGVVRLRKGLESWAIWAGSSSGTGRGVGPGDLPEAQVLGEAIIPPQGQHSSF